MEMYGNGFTTIGMKTTTVLHPMEVTGKTKIAHIGFLVGEAGIAMLFCVVRLADSEGILRIVSVIWGLDFRENCNLLLPFTHYALNESVCK
jgi:uracil phosphoribosyltransferase